MVEVLTVRVASVMCAYIPTVRCVRKLQVGLDRHTMLVTGVNQESVNIVHVTCVSNMSCKLCAHEAKAHSGPNGVCRQPIKIEAKVEHHMVEKGADRWVICNCPELVYSIYHRHWVKIDFRMHKRLVAYLESVGDEKARGELVPTKTDIFRTALEEFLKSRGY
jgi:hypothetical protein